MPPSSPAPTPAAEPRASRTSNRTATPDATASRSRTSPTGSLTPAAVAAHRDSVEVFSVGDEANEPTKEIAENGNLQPLVELIQSTDAIRGSAVGTGPAGTDTHR